MYILYQDLHIYPKYSLIVNIYTFRRSKEWEIGVKLTDSVEKLRERISILSLSFSILSV